MSEMPERIWAWMYTDGFNRGEWLRQKCFTTDVEYIRADLAALSSAAVAEREPVAQLYDWTDDDGETQTDASTQSVKSVNFQPVHNVRPLYLDPPPLSELEAENARLKVRLAEALKALEPFAAIEWADEDGWSHDSPYRERVCDWFGPSDFRAARRVREGGKVDG